MRHWTPLPMEFLMFLWHQCRPRDIDIRIDFKVEAHMLSVWFETLIGYPNAQSPNTGVLIGLDDANLTCIVTVAYANDLTTTSTPAPRAIETRITQHKSVRVVRRCRDRHLWTASVAATFCRATAQFTKPVTPYKFSACMHSRVFPCPYHLSQGRHSMFLRPGHDLRSSVYPKRQRRGSASMLFRIKFIYTAGVSLSCDIGGKARPLRRMVADFYPLFRKRIFQGLTDWDLLYKQWILCVNVLFLWSYQVLGVAPWPPSYHKLLNETVTTFAVFPHGCTFSMVRTMTCCPCH